MEFVLKLHQRARSQKRKKRRFTGKRIKLNSSKEMKVTKNGVKFNTIGNEDFWRQVNNNKWENYTFDIMEKYLDKDHSYLDIGAWIGPTVLFGAQKAGACYAFEPDPVAFKSLKRNLELNPEVSSKNVFIYEKAVSSGGQNVKLGMRFKFGDSMSSILWSKKRGAIEVESIPLSFLFEHTPDLNFIKMDIEGGEASVLSSIVAIHSGIKPTLLLALHAMWFEDKDEYFSKIIPTLKMYKNIYDMEGNKITPEEITKYRDKSVSVLATDL